MDKRSYRTASGSERDKEVGVFESIEYHLRY